MDNKVICGFTRRKIEEKLHLTKQFVTAIQDDSQPRALCRCLGAFTVLLANVEGVVVAEERTKKLALCALGMRIEK